MQQKSWENADFITSKEARPLRVLAELLEPQKKLAEHNINNTIVFFGSARIPSKEAAQKELNEAQKSNNQELIAKAQHRLEISKYYELAVELSKMLSLWAKNIKESYYICTGGGPGIMEAANKGAYLANHPTIGLNINIPFEQGANKYITKDLIFNFNYFFMRKFWFTYLAKAIVIFPGGFGTIDEMSEILTLIQTKKIQKKLPIVLFGTDFFKQTLNLEIMLKYGLISPSDKNLFLLTDSIEEAYNYIITQL